MKKVGKYIFHSAVILVIAVLIALQRDLFDAASAKEAAGILSDAFFVPGVLYTGIGILSIAASKGTYDMLAFGSGKVMSRFIPTMDKEKYRDYYAYRCQKDEKGRTWNPLLLIIGLITCAVAVIAYLGYCFL